MGKWLNLASDQGGVFWGILCCWLAVLANVTLLGVGVTIFYIVPLDLFGVPIIVSLLMWLAHRWVS